MIIESSYQINEEAIRNLVVLQAYYDVLASNHIEYGTVGKNYLSDSVIGRCRFCKRSIPDTTFHSLAHAIPEFTGNKSLFSKFECDQCNQLFSKFESEFANFMLPYNALGGVKNKSNKSPKYKQQVSIKHTVDGTIHITNLPGDFNPNTKEIDLILRAPSYIPDFIYRSLIKIGLTLIPEEVLEELDETLNWLMDINADTLFPGKMVLSVFPFNNPSDKIIYNVFRRKKSTTLEFPDILLIFCYRNFSFQTYFPIRTSECQSSIKPFPVAIPTPLDLDLVLSQQSADKLVVLSGKERIRDENAEFKIQSLD